MTALLQTGVEFPQGSIQTSAVRTGVIWMWSGAIANIPSGYQLCDGTNGTPDLRDRFIVTAGGSYSVGATGGSATISLDISQIPVHSHAIVGTLQTSLNGEHSHTSVNTSTQGNHKHPFNNGFRTPGPSVHQGPGTSAFGPTSATAAGGSHSHPVSITENGLHNHAVTGSVGNIGSGQHHENRPPFYALAFIMKV